jgi:hypothetical protein
MTEKMFTCKEHVFDRRDPNRPAVFIAAAGEEIPFSAAVKLGLVKDEPAAKKVTEAMVEDKAVKPAETKVAPRKSKA